MAVGVLTCLTTHGYAVDVWMDAAAIQIFSRLSIEPLPELKTELLSSGF